jgi:hypothetical protein
MRVSFESRTGSLCPLLIAMLGYLHAPAEAQMYVELRGGTAVGSHTATAAAMELEPGLSVAGLLLLQTSGVIGIYAGFVRTEFGCINGFCTDRDITITGNDIRLGLSLSRGRPWLQFGLLYGGTGAATDEPNGGLGFETSLGLAFSLGKLRFSPGLAYRRHDADTAIRKDHAVSLSLDLGVQLRLGILSSPELKD